VSIEPTHTLSAFAAGGEFQPSNLSRALTDLTEGLGKAWIWTALATQDIRMRYRGSMLGPFWLTLTIVIMVGSMGFLYAKLFKMDVQTYLPFLTVGMVFWQLISSTIGDSCNCLVAAISIVRQVRMPFSVHVYRMLYRNIIVLGHTIVIIPIVLVFFRKGVDWHILLLVPGLMLLAVDGLFLGLILGMVSARFRDVPPIVQNLVQVLFFVTPIFWAPAMLGKWETVASLNPLFAAVDILRSPILGPDYTPFHSYIVMLAFTVLLGAIALPMFSRYRARIPYWV
jgi:ABC-type polysaccharide/polyol phosphate export permease